MNIKIELTRTRDRMIKLQEEHNRQIQELGIKILKIDQLINKIGD